MKPSHSSHDCKHVLRISESKTCSQYSKRLPCGVVTIKRIQFKKLCKSYIFEQNLQFHIFINLLELLSSLYNIIPSKLNPFKYNFFTACICLQGNCITKLYPHTGNRTVSKMDYIHA